MLRQIDGWMDRQTDRMLDQMRTEANSVPADEQTYRQTDAQMDILINRRTDRWTCSC